MQPASSLKTTSLSFTSAHFQYFLARYLQKSLLSFNLKMITMKMLQNMRKGFKLRLHCFSQSLLETTKNMKTSFESNYDFIDGPVYLEEFWSCSKSIQHGPYNKSHTGSFNEWHSYSFHLIFSLIKIKPFKWYLK